MSRSSALFATAVSALALCATLAGPSNAQQISLPARPAQELGPPSAGAPADSLEVARAVERFHQALAAGDSATVLALLADDVIILESGGRETKAEYRAHHLGTDIEFARAVPRERTAVRVHLQGDAAWASSTSTAQGEFRGRAVRTATAELMVLTRTDAGWRIRAIHWSSRALRAAS